MKKLIKTIEWFFLKADRSSAFKPLSKPQTDVFISSGLFMGGQYQLQLHQVSWPKEKSSVTLHTRDHLTRIPPLRGFTLKGKPRTSGKRKRRLPLCRFQAYEFTRHPGMSYGSPWSSGNYKQQPLGQPVLQTVCTGPLCIHYPVALLRRHKPNPNTIEENDRQKVLQVIRVTCYATLDRN